MDKNEVCWHWNCDAKYVEGEFVWHYGKVPFRTKKQWGGPKLLCREHAEEVKQAVLVRKTSRLTGRGKPLTR